MLIVILVTRQVAAEAEYEVSIFGGYEDENNTSEDITESLLMSMQVSLIPHNTTCWLLMLIMCCRHTRRGSGWWWRPRAG